MTEPHNLTVNPDGHGSGSGGGDGGPLITTNCPGSTTNQQLLVLPHTLHPHSRSHQDALTIIQLEFARNVSAQAASAYDKILDVLRPPQDR